MSQVMVIGSAVQNQVVLAVALPLLAAFLLPVIARASDAVARLLGPFTLILALLFVFSAWHGMDQPFMIAIGGFAPPMGIAFYVDSIALLFAALVLIMCLLLWPWHRTGHNSTPVREASLTLLLAAASCGLALSGDLFNIYVFYELASVASFGLVAAAAGTAYLAAIRYVIISGFGTVLALSGIALIYTQTGTLNIAHLALLAPEHLYNTTGLVAFTLILLGIGVKAELFPVNTWVPEVYATASKRVTALLAGLVSKLAVLVLVRLLVTVFQTEQALQIMLLLGLLGIIGGELAAWRSKDMSRMLAYSSIGQLGMVFIAFSIPGEAGVIAGMAVALHHLLVKPGLFLLAEKWGRSIQGLHGAAMASPTGALLFLLFALSLVGVPPLPGFWAKLLVVSGLAAQDAPFYLLALGFMLAATVIEANYFFRVVVTLYGKPGEAETTEQTTVPEQHAQGGLALATSSVFAVVLLVAMVLVTPLGQQLDKASGEFADVNTYINTVYPGQITTAPSGRSAVR